MLIDVVTSFQSLGAEVDVHDPLVDPATVRQEYGIKLTSQPEEGSYDAIILAVPHTVFRTMSASSLRKLGKPAHVLFEVKHSLGANFVDGRL